MRYLLLIYTDEKKHPMTEAELACKLDEHRKLNRDLASQLLAAEPLQPIATATSVRVREGKTLVTDGPFAETKEQLGGFYMIEAKDLDEAIAWAARIPNAREGTIEVRPIWEIDKALR